MENASATRLRFKGSATSSHKRRKHSDSQQHTHRDTHRTHSPSLKRSKKRSRSRSQSPRRLFKDDKNNSRGARSRSRSRSYSPSSSSYRSQSRSHSAQKYSSKYSVTPAGYAPDSLDSYLFDNEELERIYLLKLKEKEREYDIEQQQAEESDPWLNHLFDEMANDDPYEYQSNRYSVDSEYKRKNDNIQSLSDDAYSSYMRKGMGRSQAQKEAQEWADWVKEQEENKYKEARREQKRKDEERSRRRQERRQRERLDEETETNTRTGIESHQTSREKENTPINRLRKQVLVNQARKDYEQGWKALLIEDRQGKATVPFLSMAVIPWPPLYGTSESPDTSSDSACSLFDFLFFGTTADQTDVRKQLLRREQLKFHPDKFKQKFGARLPPEAGAKSSVGERERILEQVDKVARALNEISEML
ncbi:hypothetical protein FBU30_002862 [Linnemannia zychae]|nr:hypothetical protein FBU30_002862 [Linnemannia zychae]